jgi:hypothetical protein
VLKNLYDATCRSLALAQEAETERNLFNMNHIRVSVEMIERFRLILPGMVAL